MASSRTDMDNAIATAAHSLWYVLKPEQRTSIFLFASGSDVFVSLPTGYGKTLCYTLLPSVFDLLRRVKEISIVLVVSPLLALMKDQVASISEKGLSAVFISDKDSTPPTVKREIKNGNFQVVFTSPECLFLSMEWKNMWLSNVYQQYLIGFVVDEAHRIKKW